MAGCYPTSEHQVPKNSDELVATSAYKDSLEPMKKSHTNSR
jgi:hypothetical protein